ncbi:hypothetical protein HY091_00235 [Candidatus Kaiserbacteria bacterium]|nr:hypothetical protein [Candidatus Kaiserbacteria bacterium]
MMRHHLLISSLVIALVIGIGFAISVPHTRDLPAKHIVAPVAAAPTITLHDAYKKGTHTLTGSLVAPDACTAVSAAASLIGDASSSERIALAIAMPPNAGVCLEIPTPMTFSTTISAPAGLPIDASVNGIAASTTPL